MTAIATEDRTTVPAAHPRSRLWLAPSMKPQRDRAVIRALLRVLGVAFTEAEIIAPVEAPIDVRFRQAQFHVRELGLHQRGGAWQAHDTWMHQRAQAWRQRRPPQAGGGEGPRGEYRAGHRRPGRARRVVWRPVCRLGCRGRCRWVSWRAGPGRARSRERCVGPARLALGVGGVSALWESAICCERCAGLSAHGDRAAVTAMGEHRPCVRKGQALTSLGPKERATMVAVPSKSGTAGGETWKPLETSFPNPQRFIIVGHFLCVTA